MPYLKLIGMNIQLSSYFTDLNNALFKADRNRSVNSFRQKPLMIKTLLENNGPSGVLCQSFDRCSKRSMPRNKV